MFVVVVAVVVAVAVCVLHMARTMSVRFDQNPRRSSKIHTHTADGVTVVFRKEAQSLLTCDKAVGRYEART